MATLLRVKWLLLLGIYLPATVFAAGSAQINSAGETSTIYWQDINTVRVDAGNAREYLLLKDDKVYSLYEEAGQLQAMEVSSMLKMLGQAADALAQEYPSFGMVESIKATGKTANIAGINGHVYQLHSKDARGEPSQIELVLSNDARVVEMTQTYLKVIENIVGSKSIASFLAALPKNERGLLQSGEDFKLLSINAKMPDKQLFTLPAQTQNVDKLLDQAAKEMQMWQQELEKQLKQRQ